MQAALEKAGVPVELLRVPGAGHGPTFPGAVNPPDYIGAMIAWFDRYLPPAPVGRCISCGSLRGGPRVTS